MSAPKWAVGMRKLGCGIYVDPKDESLHVSEREICEEMGVPPTVENCRIARETAIKVVQEVNPQIEVEEVDES